MGRDAWSGGAAPNWHDRNMQLEKIVKQPYLVKFGVSPGLRNLTGQLYQ